MSSEGHPPTIPISEDSLLSVIPTSESVAAKENRALRLRVLEMWDAWSNGRELPSAIPSFPEFLPRASGNSNVPINYPNTPLGYPTISAHFTGTPSEDISRWHIWDDLARDFVRQFQYNIDIAPDRNSLSNLKKKLSKCFREYAVKWREQVARVKPPMDETKMARIEPICHKSYIPSNSKRVRRCSEKKEEKRGGDGSFESEKPPSTQRQNPESPSYRPNTRCAYNLGAEGHDTEDCWTLKRTVENLIEQKRIVIKDEEIPNMTNNPLPAHNNWPVIGMICEDKKFDPALKAINGIADVEKKTNAAAKQGKGEINNNSAPRSEEKIVESKIGEVTPKDAILYVPRAHMKEQLVLSPPKRFELNKGPKMYVPKGTYVVRGPVIPPRLNEPVVIGCPPQKPMIGPISILWNYKKVVVTYKGKEVLGEANETNPIEKYLNLEEVNNAKQKRFPLKKLVSAEEVEEFFRKMKTTDYEVIDQLRKSPSQVSLLSLLVSSTEHQKVLIKTLNEAYVPIETTVEQLERMAERFFAVNQISFSKNDFPPEGAAHNKALHLTVKCEGYYVKRVMLDSGSGVDIYPLSTLQRIEIGTKRIRPNNVCMRAFDGIKRDTIGEIDLILTIGPVDFEVTFQVLDMDTSYNFLLGRPWIRAAGAVPSTLHQMVKFEYADHEIVVHGEDEQSIYRDPSVPCLKVREGSEHIVYQSFEVVVADQCGNGSPCLQPFLSNTSIMVATEMIKHGYKPGKGLGASLLVITEPITLPASRKFFDVGFHATETDVTWANK
ncbi:uncharacterized protein LOC142163789 [Nicotiana tabacum]|uniref:Uncharacterized protein LOC142163789 n=1 Tax=Nicotiana tabacum TaxID=4097 RepID=A0AC58RWB9_TOBAC